MSRLIKPLSRIDIYYATLGRFPEIHVDLTCLGPYTLDDFFFQ